MVPTIQHDQNAVDTRHNNELVIDGLNAIKSGKRLAALGIL